MEAQGNYWHWRSHSEAKFAERITAGGQPVVTQKPLEEAAPLLADADAMAVDIAEPTSASTTALAFVRVQQEPPWLTRTEAMGDGAGRIGGVGGTSNVTIKCLRIRNLFS